MDAGSGDTGRRNFAKVAPNQAVVPFSLWQESCKRYASNMDFVGKSGKQKVERKE